jgi:hypothetical protein
MSLSDSFRMLNSSIRGIREDKRAHERQMYQLETDRAKLEYQLNDPERKLRRQKAAEQIAPVEVDSGMILNVDDVTIDQTYAFNKSLPGLNAMLANEGVELTNKGIMVEQGSLTPATRPKWKADELKAQIGMYMSMESGKEAMVNGEIESLGNKLSLLDAEEKQNKVLSHSQKLERGRMKARLTKLQEKKNNPESYAKMLTDDNMRHIESLNNAYRLPTENKVLIDMLHKKIQLNNSMLKTVKPSASGLKGFSYTRKLSSGEVKTRTAYHMPGTAPTKFTDEAGTWTIGKHKAAPGAGTGGSARMTSAGKKVIANNKWGELERILAVSKNKAATEKLINDLISSGKAEDAEFIKGLLDKPTEEVIDSLKEQMEGMMDIYGEPENPWFTPWRRKKKLKGGQTKSTKSEYKHEGDDPAGLF